MLVCAQRNCRGSDAKTVDRTILHFVAVVQPKSPNSEHTNPANWTDAAFAMIEEYRVMSIAVDADSIDVNNRWSAVERAHRREAPLVRVSAARRLHQDRD